MLIPTLSIGSDGTDQQKVTDDPGDESIPGLVTGWHGDRLREDAEPIRDQG